MLSHTSESNGKPLNPTRVLLGIFFVALIFRLWGVTNPLLDFHGWRQTLTATMSYNFYVGEMDILKPTPSIINSIYHFEFPLYTYLVALLYKVFGFHEALGRLVAIAFSMGSIYFIYLLGKRYFDETSAQIACAFYAILPFSVYYSRTFMPESAMLFFSVAMIYMFARWLDTQQWKHFFWAVLLAACTFLVKLPTLYMGGPLLFLAWNKYRGNIIYQGKLYLFVSLILIPPGLWYSYVSRLQFEAYGDSNIWLDMLKDIEVLFTLRYWKLIFWTRLVEKMFAFTVFPFLILGMIAHTQNKERYVLHIWFFSVCAYFVIAAKYNFIHEYYQVPIIPVGCLFAGKFVADFYRKNASVDWKKSAKVWAVLIMILFIPIHSIYKLNKRLNYGDTYLKFGEEIRKNSNPNDLIIVGQNNGSPKIFYYGQRKGWALTRFRKLNPLDLTKLVDKRNGWGVTFDYRLNPKAITRYINEGARLFVMIGEEFEEKDSALKKFLTSHHKHIKNDNGLIMFKLIPQKKIL